MTRKLMLEDLKRSGIDSTDVKKMKLKIVNEEQCQNVLDSLFATDAYIIPYFDIHNKPVESIRVKFLAELRNDNNKIVKYSQPKGTPPQAYFPPNTKWKDIYLDASKPVYITEGEKKSYKACKEGFNTIGLAGVWSFKSKKLQKSLIDDLEQFVWSKRKVYLCFDNDSHSNPDVMKALRTLAKELVNRGAHVKNIILPFSPYEKIGLDDFLVNNGKTAFKRLPKEDFKEITELHMMNDRCFFVEEWGKFYVIDSGLICSSSTLVKDVFPAITMLDDEGKPKPVIGEWVKWSQRRSHKRITYKPSQPQVTEQNEFNTWQSWGAEPRKGNIKPFINAVNQIFDNDKTVIQWFLDWIAYPIQNPSTKMFSAVMLHSMQQGTGKSTLGLCIGAMYGNNYKLIDDSQLHSDFNEWCVNKQFILGDEISGKDKRQESDRLKNLITRPEVTINKKFQPTYTIPDCINYFFTSNHPDPLSLEPDDRRFFIHRIANPLTLEQGEELEYYHKGEGIAHLLYYFIHEHKIHKDFNPRSRPPMTQAKEEVIDHSFSDLERYLTTAVSEPDTLLHIDGADLGRDLFTTEEIASLLRNKGRRQGKNVGYVTTTATGKALRKAFMNHDVVKHVSVNGTTKKLRAMRNIEYWADQTPRTWANHYTSNNIKLFNPVRQSKARGTKRNRAN